METLKVASRSDPSSVAGAIVGALERDGVVEIHAISAGAVNQSVKAIAGVRRMVERECGPPIKVIPGFMEVVIAGKAKTGIRFIVER